MSGATDQQLLDQFVQNQSEAAFTQIVERHVGLVHSVALRHTTQPQHAQDITQAVFIVLACKAAGLGGHKVLAGWLYHTARLTAANFQRSESRRIRREQEAYMQSTVEDVAPDAIWSELSPLLDEAMADLGASDRDALVLRYFQNKSLNEVAAAMGIEPRAAQKRVVRAVEKLRKIFSKRGVALSATVIGGVISTNSVHAAPTGLVQTIVATGLTKGSATTGTTFTIAKGTLKLMAWTKLKTAIVAGACVLLVGGTATVITKAVAHTNASSTNDTYEQIWSHPNSDSIPLLKTAPQGFVIRPTKYPRSGGGVWTDGGAGFDVNVTVPQLVDMAYDWSGPRTVFPKSMPSGSFDLMENLPPGQNGPAFKAEIEKQFGLVAHPEKRLTDVYFLKVADPAKWRRYQVKRGNVDIYRTGDGTTQWMHFKQASMSETANALEGFFGKPLLDQSGVSGDYTFDLHWTTSSTGTDKVAEEMRAQLTDMGLQIVDGREKIEMLVVERK